MSRRRELIFVYDATSGAWNAVLDAAHKLLSPATYACHLCSLTYGAVTMRSRWSDFVKSLPHAVRFVYRDQLAGAPAPPALLERRDGALLTLLGKPEIDACATLDDLIARVRQRLATDV